MPLVSVVVVMANGTGPVIRVSPIVTTTGGLPESFTEKVSETEVDDV